MKKTIRIMITLVDVLEAEANAALAIFAECCHAIHDHSNVDVLLVADAQAATPAVPRDPNTN